MGAACGMRACNQLRLSDPALALGWTREEEKWLGRLVKEVVRQWGEWEEHLDRENGGGCLH